MDYVIASDIHGSASACEALLEIVDRERAGKLLLLGDILYHGPRNPLPEQYNPKRVAAMLNGQKKKMLCVRGNCDSEVDQMMLEFPILAEYCLLSVGNRMIFTTHGHHFHGENLPLLQHGDVLLHGHTHIPALENCGEYIYANPGSVSLPKGQSQPSYLLLNENILTLKTCSGEITAQLSL